MFVGHSVQAHTAFEGCGSHQSGPFHYARKDSAHGAPSKSRRHSIFESADSKTTWPVYGLTKSQSSSSSDLLHSQARLCAGSWLTALRCEPVATHHFFLADSPIIQRLDVITIMPCEANVMGSVLNMPARRRQATIPGNLPPQLQQNEAMH